MIFYTIIKKATEEDIGDVIQYEDGVCVLKYDNVAIPNYYINIHGLYDELPIEYELIKNGVNEDYEE